MNFKKILVLGSVCLAGLLAEASTVVEQKPSRFLSYFTCQSRAAVDTGVPIASGQKVEMKVAGIYETDKLNWTDFLCNKAAKAADNGNVIRVCNRSGKTALTVNGVSSAEQTLSWVRSQDVLLELDTTSGALTLKANGETVCTSSETLPASAGTWRLFGLTNDDKYSDYRVYYVRIRDAGGNLLADLKPCICRGQVSLYDAVSKRCHFPEVANERNARWLAGPGATSALAQTLDYAQLNYTSKSSAMWLDTGIRARSGTKVEATFSTATTSGDIGFVGARHDTNGRMMLVHLYQNKFRCGYGNTSAAATLTAEANKTYTVVSDYHCGSQTIVVDGETVYSGTSSQNVDVGYNLALFATLQPNEPGLFLAPSGTRIMRVKIWQGNADGTDYQLVRDYTPVWQDGYFGYVDSASGTSLTLATDYYSWPSETFEDTKPESYLQYVETGYGALVDTGVVAADGLKTELDLAVAYGGNRKYVQLPVLSVMTAKAFEPFALNNTKARVSYGGTQTEGTAFRLGERQTVVSEMFSGSQRVTVNGEVFVQASSSGYSGSETLQLFGRDSAVNTPVRLYGLKIWKGAADGSGLELVRDFKPAVCAGRVALYDTVGEKAYFDTLTVRGTLVAGPRVGAKPKFYESLIAGGTQFVDTRVVGRSPVSATADVTWDSAAKTEYMILLGNRHGSNVRMGLIAVNADKWQLAYGGKWWDVGSGAGGTSAIVEASLAAGSQTMTVNGTQIVTGSEAGEVDTGLNLYAFARNYDGASDFAKATCRSMTISQDGATVRSFRACRLDGHSGFWDDVTESFFPSGAFPFTIEQEFATGPRIPVGLMIYVR